MQMTPDARAWLDSTVRRMLARHALGDAERAGVTYELMSHLHAGGEARALAAGRSEVSRDDLEGALADAGGDAGLAVAFVQPLAKPLQRVLFWRRLGAFAIDTLLLGIIVLFVHGVVTPLLETLLGNAGGPPLSKSVLVWLGPWAFHEPVSGLAVQAIIGLASAVIVLGYFAWSEARDGRSPGKRALELRVMRDDGAPMTGREALLRNLVKVVPALLLVDTLLMLIAFGDDKQRLSDRIAHTIVVRA